LRGHSVGEPRLLLGSLITAHMLALAFWLGALAPLADAARRGPPARAAALAREFGAKALWAVGALVLAGAGLFVRLAGASAAALGSDYGAFFAIKLAVFAGVFGLAALNRLRLTPALAAEAPGAAARLRRSIGVEAALIGVVLLITAAATTLTAPATL
ncbi:MAG: CopD family protein, partial [Pseudomonadota bacterium]